MGCLVEALALVEPAPRPEPLAFRRLVGPTGQQDAAVVRNDEVDTELGHPFETVRERRLGDELVAVHTPNWTPRVRKTAIGSVLSEPLNTATSIYRVLPPRAGGVAWYPSAFGWP